MQKVCYYNIHDEKFAWGSKSPDVFYIDNTTCCIMSIVENRQVYLVDLSTMVIDGIISKSQFDSIVKFDSGKGTTDDFNIIKLLAKKFNVVLKKKKQNEVNR